MGGPVQAFGPGGSSIRGLQDTDVLEYADLQVVKIPVTKKELAERYGVARTSLSRELKRMENDGLLKLLDGNYVGLYTP